jgi:hypothetical protein
MPNNFFKSYGFWHVGEGFQTILMMWYMAFHTQLTATEIGFYQSLQLLPFLAFTALGGNLTDRIGARLSFSTSTGLFALTLVLYGLAEPVFGFQPWLFATYCLISGLLSALSNPAIDTFIPEATPRPAPENALLAATVHNVAKLTGNAATLLLPVLSAFGGFLVNGALMVISVIFLLRHPRPPRPVFPQRRPHALRRVPAHFRNYPESFDIFLASVMLGLLVFPGFYIFQPLFGLTGLASWLGAIMASSLSLRFANRIRRPGRVALAVWAASALGFMALTVVNDFVVLLILLLFLGGNSVGKALIYGHFLRDAPEADRGLLIGIDQTALWGLATLGTFGLGWLVDAIGFEVALLLNSGAVLVFVAVLALRGRLWRLGQGGLAP